MKKSLLDKILIILIFLLSSPCILNGQTKIPPKNLELLNQGKKLYEKNCIPCHGIKGDGKGQLGPSLNPPPRDFNLPFKQWPYSKGDLRKVFQIISKGIPNTSMIKWDHLSEQERWGLVYYVVEYSASKSPLKKK